MRKFYERKEKLKKSKLNKVKKKILENSNIENFKMALVWARARATQCMKCDAENSNEIQDWVKKRWIENVLEWQIFQEFTLYKIFKFIKNI